MASHLQVREGDRDREAASSGSVGGFVDREGVELAAKALMSDQRLRAMSGTNMPRATPEGGEVRRCTRTEASPRAER